VPPIATKSAITAIAVAGDGLGTRRLKVASCGGLAAASQIDPLSKLRKSPYAGAMGKRARKRDRGSGGDVAPAAVSEYRDDAGNVLTLRDDLSAGTLSGLERLDAKPAANAEDRWQRRVEYLFERLAVRWEISGLPLEGQKELLGRYRMASADERRAVRAALAEHLRARYPQVDV
jgi:hypothetical protein